jgi:hypothetical protein
VAEPAGLNGWVAFLGEGHSARELEAQIMASPEYFLGRGEGTAGGFMTAVYQDLTYLDADQKGFQSWSQFLAGSAGSDPIGGVGVRFAVVTGFLHSWLADATAAEAWFNQYLQRPVDDASFTPLIDAMQQGMGDEQFIDLLLGSAAYLANHT